MERVPSDLGESWGKREQYQIFFQRPLGIGRKYGERSLTARTTGDSDPQRFDHRFSRPNPAPVNPNRIVEHNLQAPSPHANLPRPSFPAASPSSRTTPVMTPSLPPPPLRQIHLRPRVQAVQYPPKCLKLRKKTQHGALSSMSCLSTGKGVFEGR